MNEQISAYLQRNWLELAGVATGIVCVYYNARQNAWGWVWSMVSVGIYFVIFLRTKLYADAGLQVFFFVVSAYGIYEWLFGGENRTALPVSRFPKRFILPTLLAGLAFWGVLSWVLHRYTDAALPYLDSALTTVSLVAQWMLARKYLENWLLWIGADVVYVGMYIVKDLHYTAFLYFVFLGLAAMGYVEWRKTLLPALSFRVWSEAWQKMNLSNWFAKSENHILFSQSSHVIMCRIKSLPLGVRRLLIVLSLLFSLITWKLKAGYLDWGAPGEVVVEFIVMAGGLFVLFWISTLVVLWIVDGFKK